MKGTTTQTNGDSRRTKGRKAESDLQADHFVKSDVLGQGPKMEHLPSESTNPIHAEDKGNSMALDTKTRCMTGDLAWRLQARRARSALLINRSCGTGPWHKTCGATRQTLRTPKVGISLATGRSPTNDEVSRMGHYRQFPESQQLISKNDAKFLYPFL